MGRLSIIVTRNGDHRSLINPVLVTIGLSGAGEAENEAFAVHLTPVHRLEGALLSAHLPGDRFRGLTERIPDRRGQEWSGGCFRVIPNRFPALNSAKSIQKDERR